MRKNSAILILLTICFFVGCAKIEYIKVPTPTQYDSWTDENQRKADAMKGVRYYLPRPFLHLKESIPVSQRVAFISFKYDEIEGAYVIEPPTDPPTWLKRVAPSKISIGQALAATIAKSKVAPAGEQQRGEVGDNEEEVEEEPQPEETPEAPPSELKASTGFINQTDPVTRLSSKMDVVYFPDFEEQYVIRASTGLGKAEVETRLRNGWAAEVFSQNIDNSQLVPYAIRQVESASKAASGIVTEWMPLAAGLPPGTSPATLLELAGIKPGEVAAEMQAGGVTDDAAAERIAKDFLGQALLFKIAEVRIAQPGIYPILKPREIRQWLKYSGVVTASDPQATFELFLLMANVPWIRPDMAFIPCPPITMVGFNTTTDIFLAPATDRSMLTVSGDEERGEGEVDLTQQKKDIKSAMVKKKGDIGADAPLVNDQGIKVERTSAGNGTVITIEAPKTPAAKFSSDDKALKAWVINVFSPTGSTKLNDKDVTVMLDKNKKIATIQILINITDLAERAKKVK